MSRAPGRPESELPEYSLLWVHPLAATRRLGCPHARARAGECVTGTICPRACGSGTAFAKHSSEVTHLDFASARVPPREPPRRGRELWELLRRRWCELTAPWRELIAAGTSWRELLQDLELRLDLDLGSDDDSEDREYVRGLFEAEYAEAMSYEGHD